MRKKICIKSNFYFNEEEKNGEKVTTLDILTKLN